jgi:hypothetical protein
VTTPTEARAGALQELADTRGLLDALEECARDGDATVTAQELRSRADLVRLAELRVEHAERTLAAWDATERREAYQALADEARAVAGIGHSRIADRHTAAVAALANLYDAAAERERRLRNLRARARQVYALAQDNGELPDLFATGITEPTPGAGLGASVDVDTGTGPVRVHHVDAAAVTLSAAAAALESRTRHSGHTWSTMHVDLVALAAHVDRALPGVLPDDWRHTR